MVIRAEQMAVFRSYMVDEFVRQCAVDLRARHPEQLRKWDDVRLRGEVRAAVDRARGYGIRLDADIRLFLECWAACGMDFDAGAEILESPTAALADKRAYLENVLELQMVPA